MLLLAKAGASGPGTRAGHAGQWAMAPDDLPIVPHEVTGADCCGCLIAKVDGDHATIPCNECGAVIRTVPVDDAEAALIEIAAHATCTAECPHCGFINTFPGFKVMDAFICGHCGECVGDHRPVRPLPQPPLCRGIPVGDGNFTRCAYGYGDIPPFTGPCDCPVCNGSGIERGYQQN